MLDANILSAVIASRSAYDKIAQHLSESDLHQPPARFWWGHIVDWYARDPSAAAIDVGILIERGKRYITNPKHEEGLVGFMRDLPPPISPENVAAEVLELHRYSAGNALAQAIAGRRPRAEVLALTSAYEILLARESLQGNLGEVNDDDQMFEFLDRRNAIPIAPLKLNERCGGGAVAGDHIVLYGRPEAGKSLFAVNMAAGFLKSGQRVLYIGNEEDVRKTRMRILNNLANCTKEQALASPQKALHVARERGWDGLFMAQPEDSSLAAVVQLVEKHQPKILILDQIRGMTIDGPEGSNMTQKLSRLAIEVRAVLKKYGLVGVSVTQANDRTERHGQEPPPWLTMGDVDSSRTGLPAQADLLVGIGSTAEMVSQGIRAISLPKNKLGMSHDPFTVEVDLLRSKVR